MSERYETILTDQLADILVDRLRQTLVSAGFDEVLRIPEPDVTEYRRGAVVLTLTRHGAGRHRQHFTLEAEGTDVQPLVGEAAREVILGVCRQILAAMPWVDREALERDVDRVLREGLAQT